MKKILIGMVMLMMGCVGRPSTPFVYLSVPEEAAVSPKVVYHLYVEDEFSGEDKAAISAAVGHWNFALNGYVKIEIVSLTYKFGDVIGPDDWTIVKIDHSNGKIKDGKRWRQLAFADKVGGKHLWIVRDRIKDSWMVGIVLHELGHLLGASHEGKDLMQPHFVENGYVCVDEETLKQVAQHQQIPFKKLNFCIRYDKDFFD
jgi:hypothetical protein